MTSAKYGNRNVPKMIGQVDALRAAIRAEGTEAIQSAWDKVEEHIDFAYRADVSELASLADEVIRLRAERDALRAREAEAMAFTESAVRTGYINTMRMHNWLQGGAK